MNLRQYSEFGSMQALGEHLAGLGEEGPARKRRWRPFAAGVLVAGLLAVSPVGAAVKDAIEGSETPTADSRFLGDSFERQPSRVQQQYFNSERARSFVVGSGETPAGTGYELIAQANSGPLPACAFVGFDGVVANGSRDTETCFGRTVDEGFRKETYPVFPTIYRGPVEGEAGPTPVIIGVAPPAVASVSVTYTGDDGTRVEAASDAGLVTASALKRADRAGPTFGGGPVAPYAHDPFLFFAAFLPAELDASGPQARQPRVDYDDIEVAALDADGDVLSKMRMDGRFSGDPGVVSVG